MTEQEAHELMAHAAQVGSEAEYALKTERPQTMDKPEDVTRCLNCPISVEKCAGVCQSGAKPKAVRRRRLLSEKTCRIAQLKKDGWRDRDIVLALGVTPAVVGYHKRRAREIGLL